MQSVYEIFFFMKYSGGWSFSEAYSLPIGLRNWFADRLAKQLQMEKEAVQSAQKGNRGKTHTLGAHNQPMGGPQRS
jgi:hypothetical protein